MKNTENISVILLITKGFICLNNSKPTKKITIDDFLVDFNWKAITPFTLSKEELQSILDLLVVQKVIEVEKIDNLSYYKISNCLLNPHISILNF